MINALVALMLGLVFLTGFWLGAETSRGITSACVNMRAVMR